MLYLAMTASEIAENSILPVPMAYMACLFSPYGTGLSNLPRTLPEGSMLILSDRTPIMGHDPARIAGQLRDAAERFQVSRILLDLQRPGEPVEAVIEAILQEAACPVGVSAAYAGDLSCPVLLPPLPLTMPLEAYTAPWQGREVWLELAPDALRITLTADGSRLSPIPPPQEALPFADTQLHCHYGLRLTENEALFTLHRTREDLQALTQALPCCVGLYQELKPPASEGAKREDIRYLQGTD